MKTSFWTRIVLLMIGCFIPLTVRAAEPMFTSIWKIYEAPIEVGHVAISDTLFGAEAVYDFAYENRESDNWIYAYQSHLDIDPQTGDFTTEKESGEDRFLRFFDKHLAEIIIDWSPIEKDDEGLRDYFEDKQKKFSKFYAKMGHELQKEGEIEEGRINGHPAIGIKYKVDQGQKGYITFWIVRADKINRWFLIRFVYAKGFVDPADTFTKVKEGIIFLKPDQK